MIEILIVIGVLAVLITIAFVGFRAIERRGRSEKTKVHLSNAASLLTEYDAAAGFTKQPGGMWPPGGTARYTGAGIDIWRDNDPSTAGVQRLIGPASVDADEPNRLANSPVRNTAVVMGQIAKVSNVKSVFSKLAADSTIAVPGESQPILLDGWDSPIIFVPASGMEVVMGDPPAQYVVTSVKTYPASGAGSLPAGTIAPGARPFWASAGPDRAFAFIDMNNNGTYDNGTDRAAGDDNIYSFQN